MKALFYSIFTFVLEIGLILTLLFFALRLAPGGPFDPGLGANPETLAILQTNYGLSGSLIDQYLFFISNLFKPTAFPSLSHEGQSVSQLIVQALPISATLGISAFFLSQLMAGLWVTLAIAFPSEALNRLTIILQTLALSVPSFVIAGCLIWIFSIKLGLLPAALWESSHSLILPVLSLALRPSASTSLLVLSQLQPFRHSQLLLTARAKGLSEFQIWLRHALPLSLSTWTAHSATVLSQLVTGSFVVESIFALPGLGRLLIQSVLNRDYPLTLGISLLTLTVLLFLHRLSDWLQHWIDPRVSNHSRETHV